MEQIIQSTGQIFAYNATLNFASQAQSVLQSIFWVLVVADVMLGLLICLCCMHEISRCESCMFWLANDINDNKHAEMHPEECPI